MLTSILRKFENLIDPFDETKNFLNEKNAIKVLVNIALEHKLLA